MIMLRIQKKKSSYNYGPEETVQDKANKYGITYTPILNKFSDEDFEIVSKIVDSFRKSGNIDASFKLGWHKSPIFLYLVEFLGIESRNGNQKAALKLEKMFDPLESSDMREKLVRSYNRTRKPDSNGEIKGLIDQSQEPMVNDALENMKRLRIILKLISKYNGNEHLLPFLLKFIQLRFVTEFNLVKDRVRKSQIPKEPSKTKRPVDPNRNSYFVSDIQKMLYGGNDEKSRNDNFMKFNQANQEIIRNLRSMKANPKQIAVIDGMINSKLDSEEMMEVYPKLFKDVKSSSRVFSQTVKSKLGEYMDSVYQKHGLELPPLSQWRARDITSSQDPFKKLKDDGAGSLFKEIREMIREVLLEDITIPINVGDVILGGKFKNKKITVKEIGENDKGDITINGKPLMRFRIPKKD